jgi:uncharacterized protein (DUF58 family)
MKRRHLNRAERELIDLRLFATLEDLGLIARTAVEGFLQGLHRSPYVGFSVEFASHREYLPGDDLRHINWKVYGRQDRLYVKQYDAETNLDLHLLVDWSGSMGTRTARVSKGRHAACLAAALAHLGLRQRDAVGLTLFADGVLGHLRPRARTSYLEEVLALLTRTPLYPHAGSARALHEAAELMPRRGLVVLISDLFYETDEVLAGLDHLRYGGHDVIVFHLLDPLERRLPVEGAIRFHDLETGQEVVAQAEDVRPAYQAAIDAWVKEWEEACRAREVGRVELTTDQPLDRALYDYLGRRAMLY